jgi:cytochrome c-type biogenesis protein CcmH/NrfG
VRAVHRLLLIAPLLAGGAWAGVSAVQATLAAGALSDSSRELAAWEAGRLEPSDATRSAVLARLATAEHLYPSDPNTHELIGLVRLKGGQEADLVEAASRFARSLELRPVSPYAWASLAAAKYRQGDTQVQFERALVNAAALGAAEPQVQRTVAFYGLAVIDEVAPRTREAIDRIVANGARRDPAEMLQIAQRRGRLQIACAPAAGARRQPDARWLRICRNLEAK